MDYIGFLWHVRNIQDICQQEVAKVFMHWSFATLATPWTTCSFLWLVRNIQDICHKEVAKGFMHQSFATLATQGLGNCWDIDFSVCKAQADAQVQILMKSLLKSPHPMRSCGQQLWLLFLSQLFRRKVKTLAYLQYCQNKAILKPHYPQHFHNLGSVGVANDL